MHAKIKVSENWEEIQKAEKLNLPNEIEETIVPSMLYFKRENILHFFIDTSDENQDIMIALYPSSVFRCYWDEPLYNELKNYFNGF